MTEGKTGLRLKVLAVLVIAMFAALTTRLWFLQVLAAQENRDAAENNAVRLIEIPAQRGQILDADGVALVGSRPSLVLTINRQELGDDRERVLSRLSELLGLSANKLGERLDSDEYYAFSPIPVAVDIPEKVELYIKERGDDLFPGVDVQTLPVRSYPFEGAAAHVLGYLGQINEEELQDPAFSEYSAGDLIGRAGVEAVYEQELVGTAGLQKYLVNSLGETIRPLGTQEPEPGNDVVLTIDADTQLIAEESLSLGMRNARTVYDEFSAKFLLADAGAVVIMDPDTGGVEAMASFPTFQPSFFTRSHSNEEIERRFGEGSGAPQLNRAIAGEYPPGSTYKPWIALSGLQRNRVDTGQSYTCPGTWITPFDTEDPDAITYEFNNWTPADLGFMNLATALSRSCDTVFYPMGYSFWDDYYVNAQEDAQGADSREPLQRDLTAMGFGRRTNIDLPFEQEGRVPTAEWKQQIHEQFPDSFPDGEWYPGDLINMSIGQGDTLVTPLQLATAYSGLMNERGEICTPHVLDRVVDAATEAPIRTYDPRCRQLPFDPGYLGYVRDALAGTVRGDGTASGAFSGFPFEQVSVAGKTGTAEVDPKQDYSWFAAMVEAGGERHVVVVLVEQGGHGSTTAAPIARRIIEGLYGLEYTQFTDLVVEGTD